MIRGSHDNAELRSVGLGLFIVREIVRAHGGEVVVSSSAQAGTTFTVTFPRS
ncbi:sensory histidine kinase AtoS [compost metagenome]